jgi:hypothetical protein
MRRGRAKLVSPNGGESKRQPEGRLSRETVRLLPLVLSISALGAGVVVVAAVHFVSSSPNASTAAGAWALLAVTTLAEAFPVPLERVPVGGTSLATIFIVGTSVIYGWDVATLTAFLAMMVVETARRRPLTRTAYNSAVYALAGASTAIAILVDRNDSFVR